MEEIKREVEILESLGHKRLAVEAGEDPVNNPIEYITDAIKAIYSIKDGNGSIRRVNINIAATTIEDYKKLKAAEIGTYILFQETYHRDTYAKLHPSGPKHDYNWHTTAMDRAQKAGIDDVGIGVLYGLYDWKYETVAMFLHAEHLEKEFGVGPHTISVPRMRPAGAVNLETFPYLVPDEAFKKIISTIRLAVPYTGMHPEAPKKIEVLAQAIAGQDHDGDIGVAHGHAAYPVNEFPTVHDGKSHVEQDQIERLASHGIQSLATVFGDSDDVPVFFQGLPSEGGMKASSPWLAVATLALSSFQAK